MDRDTLEKIVLAGLNTVRHQVRESPETYRLELMPRMDSSTVVVLTSRAPIEATIADFRDPAMITGPEWTGTNFLVATSPDGPEDAEKVHRTFHKLWSQAVGTDGYVKSDWMLLVDALQLAGYQL